MRVFKTRQVEPLQEEEFVLRKLLLGLRSES